MQYLYWVKVLPLDGPSHMLDNMPLMKNWTEAAALQRDLHDNSKGRGKGKVTF